MKVSSRFILFAIFFLIPTTGFCLEQSTFDSLIAEIKKKQFSNTENFLSDKKLSHKKDPEYYVVLLNYAIHKGDQSQLTVAQGKPEDGELALRDKNGKVVGFIGDRGGYNEKLIVDAIEQTQQAIQYFRNRLDIQFGIVAIAQRIKRWDILANQLVETLKVSREINNKWDWGPINSMDGSPEEFMIQNIQSHASNLFRIESPEADKALRQISLALIEYYPRKVLGYANMGSLHAVKKEYKEAERYYRKALKIAPNDEIVRANIKRLQELNKK